jgi:hypothetical protein
MQFTGNDGNLYIAVSNGSGGTNYFRIHSAIAGGGASYQQPISREIFGSQTGADLGAIEHDMASAPTQGEIQTDTGSTTSSNTGGSVESWTPRWFDGPDGPKLYFDESQYVDAVNNKIASNYDKSVGNARKMYQNGLITLDEMEQQIRDQRKNLIQQRTESLKGTAGFFSNASPEVSQSQQGVFNQRTDDQFNEQSSRLGTLDKSWRELSPEDLQAYSTQISDVGKLARGAIQLGDAQQGAINEADTNRATDITAFNNGQLESMSSKVLNPTWSGPEMSAYSTILSPFSQGSKGPGVVAYSSGGVDYDSFGKPVKKPTSAVGTYINQ